MKKDRISTILLSVMITFLMVFTTASMVFADKLDDVKAAIEEKGAKWKAGETSISKLSEAEKRLRLGLIKQAPSGNERILSLKEPLTGLEPSLDWRNHDSKDYVTGVRDQGNCGSCWAFAATAALESYVLIARSLSGQEDDRSEQTLVSCGKAGSCSGGYISKASTYIRDYGLPIEDCFPYTATNNLCRNACDSYQSYIDTEKIYSWSYICTTAVSVTAIKNALSTYGPLVTTMDVYEDFDYYVNGVYSYTGGSYRGGHAILIVGYSDSEGGYFIVKNSWGGNWGEGGYFRIAYSEIEAPVDFGAWTIAYHKPDVATCSYSIAPTSATIPKAGDSGTFSVTTSGTSCDGSAKTNNSWIHIDSTSPGSVSYTVDYNNTRKDRMGTIIIVDSTGSTKATFTITQLRK